jgi:hypothetical protein
LADQASEDFLREIIGFLTAANAALEEPQQGAAEVGDDLFQT